MAAVIGNRNISLGVMGGTLITAACYSGGEVFGCSPYDAATTAYLKATYPLYWAQIRDYGFANPQLVPFINEDNDLIVSLVEVGKVRSINGGGSGYFKTGINNVPCDKTRFVCKYRRNTTGDPVSFGNRQSYSSRGFLFTFKWNSVGNCGWNYGNGYNEKGGSSIALSVFHEFDMDGTTGKVRVDGTDFITRSVATGVISYGEFLLLGVSWDGSSTAVTIGKGDFAGGTMYIDGEVAHTFVPFKRNGQMELLDIVTGTLATRVGTFTELIE